MKVVEEWKPIKGYEGLYEISNLGRVKSLGRKIKRYNGHNYSEITYPPKILKNRIFQKGYYQVILCKDNVEKSFMVHRLVAETFIPNPENKPEVNHKWEIKIDNRASELEWSTHKENCEHRSNILKKGCIKKVKQYDLDGNFIKEWNSIMEIKRELGINNSNIGECCKGRRKTAGGYVWRELL